MNNHAESEVSILLEENIVKRKEILYYMKIIENLKKDIKNNEKIIFKKCAHVFVRDPNALFDDGCKKYCKKCLLWADKYMYE